MAKSETKLVVPTTVEAASGFVGQKALEYARKYSEETPAGYALRARREKVLGLFDRPGGTVLDVGCGPGEMVRDLLNLDCEFWGVDPSEQMIDICNSRFAGTLSAHFVRGDASQLNFPDDYFDAVLCMGVIDALPNIAQPVQEMVRVLKPGGTLIVSFANGSSPYAWWKAKVFYRALAMFRRMTSPRIVCDPILLRRHLFTAATAKELLACSGTCVQQVVGYFYNILLSPLDEFSPRAALWLNRKLEERRLSEPDWRSAGFIVKAVKLETGTGQRRDRNRSCART